MSYSLQGLPRDILTSGLELRRRLHNIDGATATGIFRAFWEERP